MLSEQEREGRLRMDEASHPAAEAPRFSLVALLQALRPKQWIKNGFVFAGVLFTFDKAHGIGDWVRVVEAFVIFCALSSAIYLINDVVDREEDRRHPAKRTRPIAAGRLSVQAAIIAALLL